MENFEFKSAICTSVEQSKRLLELGLKKETADCRHWAYIKDSKGNPIPRRNQKWFTRIGTDESAQVCGFMAATFIPAWSLHRLICLYGADYTIKEVYNNAEECYGMLICAIEIAIEDGYFNEEYLEKQWE